MSQPSEQDPNMRAAEYVLGTLPTDEAARVERQLEHDNDLQTEVGYWEEQLGQLALALTPVDPPASAWQLIREHLDGRPRAHANFAARPAPRPARLWQGLAAAASVAAVVLAGLLYVAATRPPPLAPAATYASVFYDEPTATGWLLTANADTGEMAVAIVGDYPLAPGKELRLWVLPAAGGAPIASGIVPAHGTNSWPMSVRVAKLLRDPATVLAVSIEDAGQPVSDGPQGPVMWQASVRRRD